MVAAGGILMLVALWAGGLKWRGEFSVAGLQRRPWFMRAVIFSAILPYIAIWTGWWTREIARQPWIVHGLMRTSEGVSQMSIGAEIAWFIGFVVFDLLVWIGAWYFFAKVVRKGPDMESAVVDGDNPELGLGELPNATAAEGQPLFVRPTA